VTISQSQYQTANDEAVAAALRNTYGGRIRADSTLRDRTPVAQPTPLDDGEFIWGEPSEFTWGTNNNTVETGPFTRSGGGVNWPDYGQNPAPDDPTDERDTLYPILEQWKEVARHTRTVRVTGSNGAWVDDVRFTDVSFSVPPGPDGRPKIVTLTFAS